MTECNAHGLLNTCSKQLKTMKLPCKANTPKKYLATMVLLSLIIMTYIITRNSGEWNSVVYAQSRTKHSHHENTSMKLSADIQSKIETLVLFIGYPRSGHTLIGSLLDAHPHVVIANELNIFERWTEWKNEEKTRENLLNKMYDNSYKQSVSHKGYRSTAKNRGRSYAVPNQWQGKYKDYIKVIGDKKGGKATKFFSYKQKVAKEVLDTINLPVKLIHMVRNPYDNVATMVFRYLKLGPTESIALKEKINNTDALNMNLRLHLIAVRNNYELIKRFGRSVFTLHSEDVIAHPTESLKKLCDFLEVSCSKKYFKDCESILYTSTSKTREKLVWPSSQKNRIEQAIMTVPFLNKYTFES
ncbi:uncharacterized protein LOC114533817 [Dendronephthya gigantea]|uniref:uncharacterized protein LOC114533817 n=1 Tax=Dendronephthya gigantea TaxID=151771 RepID=UPI00106B3D0A|nr:uncharacterized protein LOC114533817 [Dendronephthya gigantea]